MPVITNDFVCTPSSLVASTPCLACLSEKEMLAAIVGIIALDSGQTIADIMKASACYTCMSKKQMLQAFVTLMGNQLLGDSATAGDVIEDIRCLECASEKALLAAILYQMCTEFTISRDDQLR